MKYMHIMVSLDYWKVAFLITTNCFSILIATSGKHDLVKSTQYTRLKCDLLYGAYVHMHYTKAIYFQTDSNDIKFTGLEDIISFENEAAKMLALFSEEHNMDTDEFLLVYVYTRKMNTFVEAKVTEKPSTNDEPEKTLAMHDFVFTDIENYFKANSCEKNISFDVDDGDDDDDSSPPLNVENSSSCHGNDDIGIDMIKNRINDNKTWINNLIDVEGAKSGLLQRFDVISLLYFNEERKEDRAEAEDHLEIFLKQYIDVPEMQRDWDDAFVKMKEIKKHIHDAGLEGIRHLGSYHRAFVDMLKVILLRLSWRFLVALPSYRFGSVGGFLFMLIQFQTITAMEEDVIVTKLIDRVKEFQSAVGKKDILTEQIEQLIKSLPVVSECPFAEPPSTETCDTVFTITEDFIMKTCEAVGSRDAFSLSKSFVRMVENKLDHAIERL